MEPKQVLKNDALIKSLLRNTNLLDTIPSTTFTFEKLTPGDYQYWTPQTLFNESKFPRMQISEIYKVVNPYLSLLYSLKKEELSPGVTEKYQFHGTFSHCLAEIAENNLDWRRAGTSRGSKFGRGVSFSPKSSYSSHYGEKGVTRNMLLCKVLVGRSHVGTLFTTIPIEGYDTTTNHKSDVIVKYNDDEFYPEFWIKYVVI